VFNEVGAIGADERPSEARAGTTQAQVEELRLESSAALRVAQGDETLREAGSALADCADEPLVVLRPPEAG
jgi:hypothetical protein